MPSPESPFEVTVYDKSFSKRGTLFCSSILVVPRHNQQPTAQLTVPGYVDQGGNRISTPRLGDMLTAGARVWIRFQGAHLLSGTVTDWEQSNASGAPNFTFQIADDWAYLARMIAWPLPSAALTAQTVEYDVEPANDAESVVKNIILRNRARITPSVTIASNQRRGATIGPVQNRFHALTERLVPLLDNAGIGVSVRQVDSGAGLLLDVYATRDYPRTLTERSGIVRNPKVAWHAPKATRVVVGGPGDGVNRQFTQCISTGDEAALGYAAESFYDATDALTDSARTVRGTQYLIENATTGGLEVELAQTAIFRYDPAGANGGVRVGDNIPIELAQGVVAKDVLRSCSLSWTNDAGLKVTPQVGDIDDADRRLIGWVAELRRSLKNIKR